jgi:hypothetical protein
VANVGEKATHEADTHRPGRGVRFFQVAGSIRHAVRGARSRRHGAIGEYFGAFC